MGSTFITRMVRWLAANMADLLRIKPNVSYTAFALPAAGTKRQNTTGRPGILLIQAGVISAPGQNGHFNLDYAPGTPGSAVAPPDADFKAVSVTAMRNAQAVGTGGAGATLGQGSTLVAFVPAGGWWRLRTETIVGYAAPTYATIGQGAFIQL